MPRWSSGFTLFELLVSITLLGLIATLVTGGLRLGAKAWDVRNESFEQTTELQAVRGFLTRQLSGAHPLSVTVDDGVQLAFDGSGDALTFATLMPAHLGLGGFYLFSLQVEEGNETRRLSARWRLFRAEDGLERQVEDEEGSGRSVLLDGIGQIELAYYGITQEDDRPEWRSSWREREFLPSLIRLSVRFPDGDRREWPTLVVAPIPSGSTGDIADEAQDELPDQDQ